MLSRELREFALTPDRYTRLSDTVARFDDGRFVLIMGTTWAGVGAIRVAADEVEALVAETRERIPGDKWTTWWLDPDVEPPDLYERLLSLGFTTPADRADTLHALVCVDEPAAGAHDVRVTRVERYDDFLAATDVSWAAFETPRERREQQRPHLRAEYESAVRAESPVTFLARVDGEPAGIGRSVYSDRGVFLIAGGVLPRFRGRGVYRALVRARWEDAVARGTPALVTEAMPDSSYPILKRLGFVDVGTIRRLEDRR